MTELHFTIATSTLMLSIAGVIVTLFMCNMLHAIWRVSKTIREKDFSLKPEYDKSSGYLKWSRNHPWYL